MTEDRDSPDLSLARRVAFVSWTLVAFGVAVLAIGIWSAAHGDATLSATCFAAGLLFLFGATIDRFELLKGFGVEAKTRALDQKIKEASAAIGQLRHLAELTGAALIEMHNRIGRWDSAPDSNETTALAQEVRSTLEGLGSSSGAIAQALRPWATMQCHELSSAMARKLVQVIVATSEPLRRELNSIPNANADDPNRVRLVGLINAADADAARVRKFNFYPLDLESYPDALMQIFNDLQWTTKDAIAELRKTAERYAEDMASLKATMKLDNAEAWTREIDDCRHSR